MIRVVKQGDEISVDLRQQAPGRGAYVHPRRACMERAVRRGGLMRTLKSRVPDALLEALGKEIR